MSWPTHDDDPYRGDASPSGAYLITYASRIMSSMAKVSPTFDTVVTRRAPDQWLVDELKKQGVAEQASARVRSTYGFLSVPWQWPLVSLVHVMRVSEGRRREFLEMFPFMDADRVDAAPAPVHEVDHRPSRK